jgi:hypothetical protein
MAPKHLCPQFWGALLHKIISLPVCVLFFSMTFMKSEIIPSLPQNSEYISYIIKMFQEVSDKILLSFYLNLCNQRSGLMAHACNSI